VSEASQHHGKSKRAQRFKTFWDRSVVAAGVGCHRLRSEIAIPNARVVGRTADGERAGDGHCVRRWRRNTHRPARGHSDELGLRPSYRGNGAKYIQVIDTFRDLLSRISPYSRRAHRLPKDPTESARSRTPASPVLSGSRSARSLAQSLPASYSTAPDLMQQSR
jgi:hypothetical protein